jgi:hypothetical protein
MSTETELPIAVPTSLAQTARDANRRLMYMGGARTRDHDFSEGSILATTLTNASARYSCNRWPEHIHPQRVVPPPSPQPSTPSHTTAFWGVHCFVAKDVHLISIRTDFCDQKFSVLEGMCVGVCAFLARSSVHDACCTFVCPHVSVPKLYISTALR